MLVLLAQSFDTLWTSLLDVAGVSETRELAPSTSIKYGVSKSNAYLYIEKKRVKNPEWMADWNSGDRCGTSHRVQQYVKWPTVWARQIEDPATY